MKCPLSLDLFCLTKGGTSFYQIMGYIFRKAECDMQSLLNKRVKPIKENKRSISIRIKLNACILGIIFVFSILLVYIGGKSAQYINRYSIALENINKINYIKTQFPRVVSVTVNLCGLGSDIESSGNIEIIDTIREYSVEIGDNIGDDSGYTNNKSQYNKLITDIDKFIDYHDQIVAVCGDTYGKEALDIVDKMSKDSTFVSTSAEQLLASEIDRSQKLQEVIHSDFRSMMYSGIIVVAVVIIFSMLIGLVMSGKIVRTMIKLQKSLSDIAKGDLTNENIRIVSMDEVGKASSAFNIMKGNLLEIISKVKESSNNLRIAISTINVSVEENSTGSARVADAVEGMLNSLEEQQADVRSIVEQSQQMNSISKQVATQAQSIHNSSQIAHVNAQDGIDKMVAHVKQMGEINRAMQEMKEVFSSFSNDAKEMTEILNSIVDIAEQTNLLSLNASIEAARAGEAGRGFAVVATEIRNLADDSQNAASKIGEIINNVEYDVAVTSEKLEASLRQLEKGNQMIEETKCSFESIQEGTAEVDRSVVDIIERVNFLSDKITDALLNIDNISKSSDNNVMEINEVSAIVTEEVANLQEVSGAMGKLLKLTNDLDNMVSEFNI